MLAFGQAECLSESGDADHRVWSSGQSRIMLTKVDEMWPV